MENQKKKKNDDEKMKIKTHCHTHIYTNLRLPSNFICLINLFFLLLIFFFLSFACVCEDSLFSISVIQKTCRLSVPFLLSSHFFYFISCCCSIFLCMCSFLFILFSHWLLGVKVCKNSLYLFSFLDIYVSVVCVCMSAEAKATARNRRTKKMWNEILIAFW